MASEQHIILMWQRNFQRTWFSDSKNSVLFGKNNYNSHWSGGKQTTFIIYNVNHLKLTGMNKILVLKYCRITYAEFHPLLFVSKVLRLCQVLCKLIPYNQTQSSQHLWGYWSAYSKPFSDHLAILLQKLLFCKYLICGFFFQIFPLIFITIQIILYSIS